MIINANANKISIDLSEADYVKGSGAPVQNAREGRVSHPGIDYTRDCTVQKDMENSIVYTDADAARNSIVEEVSANVSDCEFDPSDFISKSMTGKDAMAAEEDGTILDEYVAGTLERTIERIKGERRDQEKAVGRQVHNVEEEREYFEEIERRIAEASQMAVGIQGISESSVKYLLENNLPLTPENINHCGAVADAGLYASAVEQSAFEELLPQIETIIADSGLEVNEENVEIAKWLCDNGVPVTGDMIRDYKTLHETMDVPPEALKERIIDEVIDGCMPEGADLAVPSRGEAADRLAQLVHTDEEALRAVFRTEADFITAKRQLEEIRLSMTIDAARTMEAKGIHLDVNNLVKIVDELKVMERQAAEQLLVEAGVPASDENIEMAAKTLQARRDILQAPVSVFGVTAQTADTDTIEDVARAANEARIRQQQTPVSSPDVTMATADADTTEVTANDAENLRMRVAESYETVGTEVRGDLGDSIRKAFSNIDSILEELEIPITEANERAVRILAYNQMPLTKENILMMKEYDDKVTSLVSNLKPAVVTELIRRQENPLEMTIDELSRKVSGISREITADDIPFRKYIWKLDHTGGVTPEERKSMIGIYRLLDKVEKSDGAVIGQVIKDGRELSFSSLLSAVRSRKAQGMDQAVDDDFGGLEHIVAKSESISDQIGAAFGENVVMKLKKQLSPSVLRDRKEMVMEEPLELVLDECRTGEESAGEEAAYYEERAAEIRRIAAQGDSELIRFLKQLELPDSMINIHLMKNFLEQGGKAYLKYFTREEGERLADSFDDPEGLQEVYEELDEVHSVQFEEAKEQPDVHYEQVRDLARMAGSISFYRQMRRFQKYEVPIVTDRGVTSCSVTVRQGRESEKGTVEIAVESPQFGSVQATFKVTGSRVSGFITSEEEQALRTSEDIMKQFEKDLGMNGFTMERENYARGRRNSFHLGDRVEETATNDRLYLVAKLFIQNVQRKEVES